MQRRLLAILLGLTVTGGGGLWAQNPSLHFSTYLGGSSADEASAVAVDAAGNTYLAGTTQSADFLGRAGSGGFTLEPFVVKLDPSGQIVYTARFPGVIGVAHGIAVDSSGHAYVVGETDSADLPLVNDLGVPRDFDWGDGFVLKLSPDGTSLVYSTLLGGYGPDAAYAVAVDAAGHAYVTGFTRAVPAIRDFPLVNALQPSAPGGQNAFVAKLSPSGSSLVYSTYLGGSGDEQGNGIAVDASGQAHVAGTTASNDFPTVNAVYPVSRGREAFVTKLAPSGSSLVYSTFLGGGADRGWDVALEGTGAAWVTGQTDSAAFPTLAPLQPTLRGPRDAFVVRLTPAGAPTFSSYLGGSSFDLGTGIAVDASGAVHVAGQSTSSDFPLVRPLAAGCLPSQDPGCFGDAFAVKLAPLGSGILWSTFLGHAESFPVTAQPDVAAGAKGETHVVGAVTGNSLPPVNAAQPASAGDVDAFAVKIVSNRAPVCAAASASPSTILFINGKLTPVAIRGVTDPDGDPLTLRVTAIRQDEPTLDGPDASGVGTSSPKVRAERIIGGDGRVYHIYFDAADGQGGVCSGKVTVCIPPDHSTGATCRDSGPRFDSTF